MRQQIDNLIKQQSKFLNMNLIDHYGSYNNSKQEESNYEQMSSRIEDKDNKVPLILIRLKQKIQKSYPHDYTNIINCSQLDSPSTLGSQFMIQYLAKTIELKKYQFYLEASYNPNLSLLHIKGTFLVNGLFIRLQSQARIMMAMRLLSNLNQQLIPLKFNINQISGEIYLQHSSFVDATIANLKYRRNLHNFTFRLLFIIQLILKYRFVLIFYLNNDFNILNQNAIQLFGFQKIIKAAQRLKKIQSNLPQICLQTYDQAQKVSLAKRRQLINSHIQYFNEDTQGIIGELTKIKKTIIPIEQLQNESYSNSYLSNFISNLQQKYHFKINVKIQFIQDSGWKHQAQGGFGTVFSSSVKFKISDRDFMRKHSFNPNQARIQKLAKKIDTKVDRLPSKISIEKQIISQIQDEYHPNILTFFEDQRNQRDCLFSLWEDHSSLKHYLQQMPTASFYQRLEMMVQVAKGLLFLHKHGVIHVDFKPANVLVGRKLLLKLTDFGQSHITTRKINRSKFGYTFPYAAPQIYQKGKIQLKNVNISPELDVYSLGVTIYECLFGEHVWQNQLKHYKQSKCSATVVPWIVPQRFRDAGQRRVAMIMAYVSLKCISRQPSRRPTLPWIITIIQQCRLYLAQLQYR